VKHNLSYYFIPQEKNNYRAQILKTGFMLLLVGFYVVNQSVIKFIGTVKPGVLGYSSEITAEKVLDQTNIQRQNNGLPPLKYNSILSESATNKAKDMFTNNYWAHTSPSGTTPWDFFKAVDYQYSVAGENLARDFYDTESLLKGWMDSPTHKANIINSKYQEIGIGVVNGTLGGIKTTLVVQHFGAPIAGVVTKESRPKQTQTVTNPQVNPEVVNNLVANDKAITSVNSKILSDEKSEYINPLTINKIVGVIIFGLIISVLFVDGYFTLKKGVNRLTGSNISHIGFLLIILLFMLYQQQGAIF
jgi:uncharacterized protein YkwD